MREGKGLPDLTKEFKTYGEWAVIFLRALKDTYYDHSHEAPPISISFREGFLSDNVLQVHNPSDRVIKIHIHVSYPPTSEEKDMGFYIAAGATQEYGSIEMSWQFSPGGNGWISVEGCPGKVGFEILNGNQYRTW